ncbi:MAG: NlpC/P60 family protein [Calditrichia bacterium]
MKNRLSVLSRTGLFAILVVFCSIAIAQDVPLNNVQEYAKRVSKIIVPDKRVDRLAVELAAYGADFVVKGESFKAHYVQRLIDSLSATYPGVKFRNKVKLLPDSELGEKTYGLVRVSVANMRSGPKHQAEMVNQSLLGTVVRLYKEENGWLYIKNRDNYLGWITRASVVRADSAGAAAWKSAPAIICTANYGVVMPVDEKMQPGILVDLVPGARLQLVNPTEDGFVVKLPDGRVGTVLRGLGITSRELSAIEALPDNIVKDSRKFLGIPYLWGGTSSKGFDCSGFVQTVFRLNNLELPRDASQIVNEGEPIDAGDNFENLKEGDLIFFGPRPGKTTHVAIYLGNSLYIHASTSVQINSLDKQHDLYNDYRFRTYNEARRMLNITDLNRHEKKQGI